MSEPTSPRRILLRAPNPVGDLVMATGAFADLRRAFPEAHITLALKPGRDELVEGADFADEVLVDDSHRGVRRLVGFIGEVRRRRFDLAVLFTQTFRAALVARLAGVRTRIGYAKGGQSPLLTRRLRHEVDAAGKRIPVPMPRSYARLVEAAGATPGDGWPVLAISDELEERYRERRGELGIDAGERLIGVVPGAAFGASKLWPPEHIARVVDELSTRHGARSIVLSGPGEEPIVRELIAAMRTRPIDTLERPLGLALLKPFVRDLRLLFTMDTGPRHVATAFRVPTVCVIGPTHPDWTSAHLDYQEVVWREVPCGPCQLPVCPIDHTCMRDLLPETVLDRVEALDRRLGVFGEPSGGLASSDPLS